MFSHEEEIRFSCLELAARHPLPPMTEDESVGDTEDVVDLAKRYEAFVLGKVREADEVAAPKEIKKVKEPKAALAEAGAKLDAALQAHDASLVSVPQDAGAKETSAPAKGEVTYDDVKNAVLEIAKVKGRDASIDLLAPFGVVSGQGNERKGNMKGLQEKQYADVVAKAKEMLAA